MKVRELMRAPAQDSSREEVPAISCGAEAELNEAIRVMCEHGLQRLPAVDERGHVVGIISLEDAAQGVARVYSRNVADLTLAVAQALAMRTERVAGVA